MKRKILQEKLVKKKGHTCKVTENKNNHKLNIIQDVTVFSKQERRDLVVSFAKLYHVKQIKIRKHGT